MPDIAGAIVTSIVQLVVLGAVGGAISFAYAKRQKTREFRINIVEKLAGLHGRFVALRYEHNATHIEWRDRAATASVRLTEEEIARHRWECYGRACDLIGEFNGLRPVTVALFPDADELLEQLHATYQEWRRHSGADKPILQNVDGRSEEAFRELRVNYAKLMTLLRNNI